MKEIERLNNARKEIEASFTGLPHASSLLIQFLITKADPFTGLVENLTYRDLALLLNVDHAPGRKNAGTPTIESIRSYLRTIAKSCPDDFKVVSEGQKLKCQFIKLPTIYARHFTTGEVSRGDNGVKSSVKKPAIPESISEADLFLGTYESVELPIEPKKETPVKNINILNINNNNNPFPRQLPIADDFVPNSQTIARALALGYRDAANLNVIQAFIDENRAWGSRFADFNPIYLRWLAKEARKTKQPQPGRTPYASNHNSHSYKARPRERVKQAHAADFAFDETTGRFKARVHDANRINSHIVFAAY